MPKNNAMPDQLNVFQRIRYSIFPGTLQKTEYRERYRNFFNSLILHFRPRTIQERTLRFTLTWGLGGMAVVLVLILFATGLMLKFVYQPVPDRAYESIIHLQNNVLFGQLIRNIHHWSGNILLIIVFLHILRVFFTGAFHPPRQFNWIIGLGMFLAVLTSNITGYLLPWDQLAFWAITICTGMLEYVPGIGDWLQLLIRGGSDIGPATLSTFFAIHTAFIPVCLLVLMPWHFWRVRKAGGLVIPRRPDEDEGSEDEKAPTIPNLILREIVVALVLIAFIMAISVTFNAPLEAKANPGLSPNPTKAPWYFAGIQELLLHFHPLFALFIIPVFILIAMVSIPYLNYQTDTAGVWFASHRGQRMAAVAALTAVVIIPIGIIVDEFVIDFAAWMPGLSPVVSNGILPATFVLAGIIVFYRLVKKKYTATSNESIQAVFVLLVVAFIVLTITGIWFRGKGMALIWP
ncbi:MAG: cytochrome b N-terminal domain-containing protein [Deltaproteobacteria bacterium]|jgi:quinol-cytochrome oxidoreductase complex cytochrome b subunit|nr:cytochrome b N-terminal domain-containing protein [Deltaproteobacteria bacterium]